MKHHLQWTYPAFEAELNWTYIVNPFQTLSKSGDLKKWNGFQKNFATNWKLSSRFSTSAPASAKHRESSGLQTSGELDWFFQGFWNIWWRNTCFFKICFVCVFFHRFLLFRLRRSFTRFRSLKPNFSFCLVRNHHGNSTQGLVEQSCAGQRGKHRSVLRPKRCQAAASSTTSHSWFPADAQACTPRFFL